MPPRVRCGRRGCGGTVDPWVSSKLRARQEACVRIPLKATPCTSTTVGRRVGWICRSRSRGRIFSMPPWRPAFSTMCTGRRPDWAFRWRESGCVQAEASPSPGRPPVSNTRSRSTLPQNPRPWRSSSRSSTESRRSLGRCVTARSSHESPDMPQTSRSIVPMSVPFRSTVCSLPRAHPLRLGASARFHGAWRTCSIRGRCVTGATPRRARSSASSLTFSRTTIRLRIRFCVSGVQ